MQEIVAKVRKQFLEDYEQNKDEYFDGDVQRIKGDDWYVTRFVLRNKNRVDSSVEMIKNSMKWRKQMGIPFMKETDFPR